MTTKYGFGDNSQGQMRRVKAGNLVQEHSRFDMTSDVTVNNYIPTTCSKVISVVGQVNSSITDATLLNKRITFWCVSTPGQIDISIADITVGTASAELSLVVTGY